MRRTLSPLPAHTQGFMYILSHRGGPASIRLGQRTNIHKRPCAYIHTHIRSTATCGARPLRVLGKPHPVLPRQLPTAVHALRGTRKGVHKRCQQDFPARNGELFSMSSNGCSLPGLQQLTACTHEYSVQGGSKHDHCNDAVYATYADFP